MLQNLNWILEQFKSAMTMIMTYWLKFTAYREWTFSIILFKLAICTQVIIKNNNRVPYNYWNNMLFRQIPLATHILINYSPHLSERANLFFTKTNLTQILCEVNVWYWHKFTRRPPGNHLNIKMPPYQYKDPHGKDKTVLWPSYL